MVLIVIAIWPDLTLAGLSKAMSELYGEDWDERSGSVDLHRACLDDPIKFEEIVTTCTLGDMIRNWRRAVNTFN